jgi:exopolysaccharide biosynthesis protein
MNGNGFDDPEGHGRGGVITGWSVSDGKIWGQGSMSEYASVGLNDQDVLMVGVIKDFKKHNIRDLAQYGPTLIIDGKKMIKGSGGWGLQPRSAIGQREDGAILLATFDGRQPGHSLGITAGEVADILFQYGCLNAGLCDGGSSSIMMYEGEVLGKPSTPMKDTGRYLPNAFLVLRKPAGEDGAAEQDSGDLKYAPKGRSSEI